MSPSPPGLSSRQLAHTLLMRVHKQRQTLEQAMAAESGRLAGLTPQDRGFVYHLAMTALRTHGSCAALLAGYLSQPLKPSRLDITLCLHLGICQLLLLELPAHAAVDTSVELAKTLHTPLSGLVNAVLKKISREGARQWTAQDHDRLNTPDWLWQSWSAAYGEATTRAIAQAHRHAPALHLSLKNPAEREKWAETLAATLLPEGSLQLPDDTTDITALPGFAEGAWWVQDAAAALPAAMLGNAIMNVNQDSHPSEARRVAGGSEAMGACPQLCLKGIKILDLCAAPGGKTAQLAAMGATVTALDSSEKRLKRLRENLARLQLEANIIVADALKWTPAEKFDAILLDAPCSATGTLRRHPEIALLREPSDVARLVNTQQLMLTRALSWLKPEGRLVYAVCSLQPEEGEQQIARIEASGLAHCLQQRRTLPSEGVDGFFMALLALCSDKA